MSERVVIVTGSRFWPDFKPIFRALCNTFEDLPTLVVHGGATGADEWAHRFAALYEVDERVVRAKWGAFGKEAGMMRNERMLKEYPGAPVFAFPHPQSPSPGTNGCMRLARKFGHHLRVYDLAGELIGEALPASRAK